MKLSRVVIILSLILIAFFLYGCISQTESTNQIFRDIGVQEAFELIQRNQGNTDFIIIDIRTP